MAKRLRLMLKLPWHTEPEKTEGVEALLVKLREVIDGQDEEQVRNAMFYFASETFPHALWRDRKLGREPVNSVDDPQTADGL